MMMLMFITIFGVVCVFRKAQGGSQDLCAVARGPFDKMPGAHRPRLLVLAALLAHGCLSSASLLQRADEARAERSFVLTASDAGTAPMATHRRAGSRPLPFSYKKLSVTGNVRDRMAVTNVTMSAGPEPQAREALVVLYIPVGAFIDYMQIVVGSEVLVATVKAAAAARADYVEAKEGGKTAALAESRGNGMFELQISIGAGLSTVVTISYQQFLTSRRGTYEYTLALRSDPLSLLSDNWGGGAPSTPEISVDLTISDIEGMKTVTIQKPEVRCGFQATAAVDLNCEDVDQVGSSASIRFDSATQARVTLAPTAAQQQQDVWGGTPETGMALDLVLRIEPNSQPGTGSMPVGTLLVDDEGYFAHIYRNPGFINTAAEAPRRMPKMLVLVIDVSGSMSQRPCRHSGTCRARLQQAQAAAVGILEELHPEDEFSIVAFSSHAHSIFDANSHGGYGGSPASSLGVVHQASDATAVEHAMRFINGLTAEGGTNLEAAIMIGLDLALCDRAMPRRGPLAPTMQSAGVFAWFAFASALSMVVLTGTSIFICCCQKPGSPIPRNGPPRLCLPGRRFL